MMWWLANLFWIGFVAVVGIGLWQGAKWCWAEAEKLGRRRAPAIEANPDEDLIERYVVGPYDVDDLEQAMDRRLGRAPRNDFAAPIGVVGGGTASGGRVLQVVEDPTLDPTGGDVVINDGTGSPVVVYRPKT